MTQKPTFDQLGLSQWILDAVSQKGFEEPSPIQALTIPVMMQNNTDIIAQAQTGTGKTAAFGLPIIELIDPKASTVQALILTPTRELAIQVAEEISSLRGSSNLQVIPVYGGQSIDQQLRRLKKGVHIVVGTPGRVIDHLNRRTLKLKNIDFLVLDEADEMLNMGFIEDMEEIMKHTNPEKRTLLFSATMPRRIQDLARKYMTDPELITVKNQPLTTDLTEQIYYEVKVSDKFEALCRIIDIEEEFYGLVFCRTKNDVDNVVAHLLDRGYDADAIHGDISQGQREKTLNKFKKRHSNVLVATDVAARGIDVNDLTHVINYSLPHDPEAYVHRIGRTGRAGKRGTAITFITPSEYKKLMFIQRIAKTDIKKSRVPNVNEIIKAKKKKIDKELTQLVHEKIDEEFYNWAKSLLEDTHPTEAVARLLSFSFKDDLDPSGYTSIKDLSASKGDRGNRRDRNRAIELEGQTRLFVALGHKDKITPKKLVNFIIENTGVKNTVLNNVEVYDKCSFINVPFKEAGLILKVFQKLSGKNRPLVVKARTK